MNKQNAIRFKPRESTGHYVRPSISTNFFHCAVPFFNSYHWDTFTRLTFKRCSTDLQSSPGIFLFSWFRRAALELNWTRQWRHLSGSSCGAIPSISGLTFLLSWATAKGEVYETHPVISRWDHIFSRVFSDCLHVKTPCRSFYNDDPLHHQDLTYTRQHAFYCWFRCTKWMKGWSSNGWKMTKTETIPYEDSYYGHHAVSFFATAYVSTTSDDWRQNRRHTRGEIRLVWLLAPAAEPCWAGGGLWPCATGGARQL